MGFFVFSTDTTVQTSEGDVPISEIEIGDTVIAYDEDTGETGEYTVTDTISHEDDQIAYVTINGEEIETTPWHLFYTSDGWVEVEDLEVGDSIVSLGDEYGTVDSVIIVDAVQTMYDLTVEEVHTFAVGEGDWVVHNTGCTDYSSDPRFDDFSRDPDHNGNITTDSQLEAQGILQAEADGIVSNPRRGTSKGQDFFATYNGTPNTPVDIKTPTFPHFRAILTQANDMVTSSIKYGRGTVLVFDLQRLSPSESVQLFEALEGHVNSTWQSRLRSGWLKLEYVNEACC